MPETTHRARRRASRSAARGATSPVSPEIVSASMVRESFAEYVSRVAYTGARVIVKRHGRPRAALVPIEDLDLLRALEDRIDLKAALKSLREGKSTTWSEVKSDLGL